MNSTDVKASVGKEMRVRREPVIVFEDDKTEKSAFPPMNKKKKSGNTSQ